MNTELKLYEPFAFWLVRQFLPADNTEEITRPISNKEFYWTMGMISFGLFALGIVFHVLGK
jgi:hypothetical protein